MATNFNSTLQRVMRELQALRARIDQQITVLKRVTQPSQAPQTKAQKKAKKARRPASVGYARDRQAFLRRKPFRKPR